MQNMVSPPPDHNSLGKGAFVIGLVGLILSFIPIIGFASWLLSPLAILCGLVALRKPPRSLAIAGVITGGLGLLICIWWVGATKSVGEALNKDTFNTTGEVKDNAAAPIIDAKLTGLWNEMGENKIAAGRKYGGHRLRFTNERIEDFEGDAKDPQLKFVGKTDDYMINFVMASFAPEDGEKLGGLKKGAKVSFICDSIKETYGEGYNLAGCKLL